MNRITLTNARQQAGVTIVEGLIALAVLALLYFAVAGYAGMSFVSSDVNRTNGELLTVHSNTRSMYSTQPNYGTANINAPLIAASAFPATLKTDVGTGTVTNNWGGSVTVVGATANFVLTYGSVPDEICAKLLPSLATSVWQTITVNGTAAAATPAGAAAACTGGGSGNTIALTSRG